MTPISAMMISVPGLTFGGVVGRDPALPMPGDCMLGLRLIV